MTDRIPIHITISITTEDGVPVYPPVTLKRELAWWDFDKPRRISPTDIEAWCVRLAEQLWDMETVGVWCEDEHTLRVADDAD